MVLSPNEWEITLMVLKEGKKKRFKVTRRYPQMSISETKVFASKSLAKKQFEDWLE